MPLILLSAPVIWAIAIASIAALIGIALLLYFFVFGHYRIKKAASDLIRSYEADHACLFGQDEQFLRRLDTISSVNLVYVDECARLRKEHQSLLMLDGTVSCISNSMKDAMKAKRYKDLREILPKSRESIESFHQSVVKLDAALRAKFVEQDEMKEELLHVQESLRGVKMSYNAKRGELTLVAAPFEQIFKKLDGLLEEASGHIDNARYTEAKTAMGSVKPVIKVLTDALGILPNYCVAISSVIPSKIASLKNRYDTLTEQGYPLSHIILRSDIPTYESRLEKIATDVKALRLNGVKKELDEMIRDIESHEASFNKETEARERYEKEVDAILERETSLERRFVALKSGLSQIQDIYLISNEDLAMVEALDSSIGRAADAKRILDAAVHNAVKQAYTSLIKKLDSLEEAVAKAETEMRSFQDRLASFRRDSERAWKAVREYNLALEGAEQDLRSLAVPELEKRALPILDGVRASLDALHALLSATPINVGAVNVAYASLKKKADDFLAAVSDSKKDIDSAEAAIVLANRLRIDDKVLDDSLSQSENLFFHGDYRGSLQTSESAYKDARSRSESL